MSRRTRTDGGPAGVANRPGRCPRGVVRLIRARASIRILLVRTGVPIRLLLAAGAAAFVLGPAAPPAEARDTAHLRPPGSTLRLDDFEDVSGWKAFPADGVEMKLTSGEGVEGRALRVDYRFVKGGGYAVVHKALPIDLPENYVFSVRLRAESPRNHLEFKLIDAGGENVWWFVRRDLEFPKNWTELRTKKRQISFAWGPAGGGEIRHVAAIEFAVTAGSGGVGTVWLDDLTLTPLPPPGEPLPPVATASSTLRGHAGSLALDGDPETAWMASSREPRPWFRLDFGSLREFGGVVVDWARGGRPSRYTLESSENGEGWTVLDEIGESRGIRDYHYLPEAETRFLRLRVLSSGPAARVALRELAVKPLDWSSSREAFFHEVASDSPRGLFPRAVFGEQAYWTVVGADRDTREVLFNEDGLLETGMGAFSIEPFLYSKEGLRTWNDAAGELSLEEGCLPIPTVRRSFGALDLTVTVFAVGDPGASSVVARYRVSNRGTEPVDPVLYLALRPFQVDPPWQTLNHPGGTAPLRSLSWDGAGVVAGDGRSIHALRAPDAFGAVAFAQGDIVRDYLSRGTLPDSARVLDPFRAASGAIAYRMTLAPGQEREVALLLPLHEEASLQGAPLQLPAGDEEAARNWVGEQLETSRDSWREKTQGPKITLPEAGREYLLSLRSQIGYILVNRAGPAIQPGTRSYARSWIRDGALTCSALLRSGMVEPVKSFLEWFAPYQYANGKIPCCVDWRGSDPVPEHDSAGEFLFLVAEYYRYTRDPELVRRLWPHVAGAVAYLDSLRQMTRTAAYSEPGQKPFFGILPPSISHEGYSAKPMHSYWDSFFALKGFGDAAFLAGVLGREEDRSRWESIRREFSADLTASVAAAQASHAIDYVPGCADLGDFDATSTTILLSPVDGADAVSEASLRRTFEKYYEFFAARRGGASWEVFTPYEMRCIGALVRLGGRDRAHELADYFLAHRTPEDWRQWPEVVHSDYRAPRGLGDLPHTWVGSDYMRSVLDMFAYDRSRDSTLVLADGIPGSWIDRAPGVRVEELPTPYGPVSYALRREGERVVMRISGPPRFPRGGLVLSPPLDRPPREVLVNGRRVDLGEEKQLVIRRTPSEVVFRTEPPSGR